MKSLPQRLKEKLDKGEISLEDAARRMHEAGFFNFVDVEGTRRFLNQFKTAKK